MWAYTQKTPLWYCAVGNNQDGHRTLKTKTKQEQLKEQGIFNLEKAPEGPVNCPQIFHRLSY